MEPGRPGSREAAMPLVKLAGTGLPAGGQKACSETLAAAGGNPIADAAGAGCPGQDAHAAEPPFVQEGP